MLIVFKRELSAGRLGGKGGGGCHAPPDKGLLKLGRAVRILEGNFQTFCMNAVNH